MAMPNDVWEEISQDIPSMQDPFLKQYMAGRENLINQEKTKRADASFRSSLSPIARRACRIVDNIRSQEQATTWKEQKNSPEEIYPGMMFVHAKPHMEDTKLWNIVRRMPKGALLHCHYDATVDFEYLFDELFKLPGMHIQTSEPLTTPQALQDAGIAFRYRKDQQPKTSLWDSQYDGKTFVRLTEAAESFPDGGVQGFRAWLYSRCTLAIEDSNEHRHGVDHIWRKFVKCFMVVNTMLHYEPMHRAYLRRFMSSLAADNVRWAELRQSWDLDYCREGHEEPETDYAHAYQVIEEEVARFKATEEGKDFWGLTTIWASLRSLPTRPIIEDMDQCITTKLEFPHLIAGYDLVGPEDDGRTLQDLLPELFWFRKQAAQEQVNLPFFFHAGETLGDGNSTDENLFDAILLGTRRIGHAYSLYKHPLLIDMVKDKRILVESCPISNEVLRLCGSVLAHSLPSLIARGVACSLCNDDPAMLGQKVSGLSHDFWQALQGWDNLGLAGLGSLAENSVRWAAFEDQDNNAWVKDVKEASVGSGVKAKRLKEWQVDWEQFCLWIVTEYAEYDDDDEAPEANGDVKGKAVEA